MTSISVERAMLKFYFISTTNTMMSKAWPLSLGDYNKMGKGSVYTKRGVSVYK